MDDRLQPPHLQPPRQPGAHLTGTRASGAAADAASTPPLHRRSPKKRKLGAILFVAILVLALAGGITGGALSRAARQDDADAIRALDTQTVGTIVACDRGGGRTGRSRCYARWEYTVDGTRYEFTDRLTRYLRADGRQLISDGVQAEVYYDPADPSRAALGERVD